MYHVAVGEILGETSCDKMGNVMQWGDKTSCDWDHNYKGSIVMYTLLPESKGCTLRKKS